MNRVKAVTVVILSLVVAPTLTYAKHGVHGNKHLAHGGQPGKIQYDYAEVISAQPIYKNVTRRVPQQQCWQESVPQHYDTRSQSSTGAILGSLIGAAIGNEVGHRKRNKQVGAVAGAILGASVGRDLSRQHDERSVRYVTEERCAVRYETHHEPELAGYNVTYRYQGGVYHTQMRRDPGARLKVRVTVEPIS